MTAAQAEPAIAHELKVAPLSLIRRLLGRALHLAYRLTGADRYDDYRVELIRGARFVVMPSVFNPRITRTGAFLAAQIDPGALQGHWEVLDMGTGSGVGAVDINPAAVRCARINALLNEVEPRIEVRQGDLFSALGDERFDLVLFNPPF